MNSGTSTVLAAIGAAVRFGTPMKFGTSTVLTAIAAAIPSVALAHPGHHPPGFLVNLRHILTHTDHLTVLVAALLLAALVVRLVGQPGTAKSRTRVSLSLAGLALFVAGALFCSHVILGT